MDKAQQLAGQIAQVDPSEGYWAMFRLAEQRRDYSRAEEQLRRAVEAAPRQVGKVIELARFLTKQGRYQEADQSFERAEKIAPNSPRLMYARADLYIKTGRNLDAAKALLERYLNATLTPEDPPRAEAVKLLRKVRGG
jgi:Flp pilus assembly protein TadD